MSLSYMGLTLALTVENFCKTPKAALLKAVQKWTGDGPRQTIVNAPDADILREIIELLKARVATGAATFTS
jgi:hypothetical protein